MTHLVRRGPVRAGLLCTLVCIWPAAAGADKYREAHAYLERHAGDLGMPGTLTDLTVAGRSDDAGGTVLRFAQVHDGVPVKDAYVVVGFDPRGKIIAANSGYVRGLDVPRRPARSEAQAVKAAQQRLGLRLPASRDVQLVIARGDKSNPGYHLAWEVSAVAGRPEGDWHVFVDSQTGVVIRTLNLVKRSGPSCVPADPATDGDAALVFTRSPVDAFDDPSLRDTSDVDAALVGCKLENLTSPTDLTGTYVNTSPTAAPRATPPYTSLRSGNQRAVDEVTAYYAVNRSKEYLNLLGFPSVMNFSIGVDAAAPVLGDNSQYVPGTRQLEFGTGGVDDAQDPDVVYHEVMHAIQDDQIPGFGTSEEAGALGEGTADFWASALTDDAATTAMGAACFAAWDAVTFNPYAGSPSTGCVRRVDGDKTYPGDLDFEVHDDGEIYSAALWRLRAALGGDVIDRLVIKSHTFLQPDAGFLDAADALHSADIALYGGAHAAAIDTAMAAGGIPRTGPAASSVGLTASAPFNCETAHPYVNGAFVDCRYTQPGARRLRVHFASFATEEGADIALVSDGNYRQVQTLSGTPFAPAAGGSSAAVKGDTIVVRFKADPSIAADGFTIDRVEYTSSNTAPVANNDAYGHYGSDTALSVAAPGVLGNDNDPDDDALTATKVSNPRHGSITLRTDGSFTYLANEDYVGNDSFTYKVNDGTANSNTATVTITVGAGCNGLRATIVGTSASNKLSGTGGNDVIAGLGGGDTILAASGDDTICGGTGNDTINVGAGDDYVDGGAGNDTLRGDAGSDRLFGGAGADVLNGGDGNDILSGGSGAPDICRGDADIDSVGTGCETISGVP